MPLTSQVTPPWSNKEHLKQSVIGTFHHAKGKRHLTACIKVQEMHEIQKKMNRKLKMTGCLG